MWDIVLKNYLPRTRPVLFRACKRISKKGKIASFTGRLECAKRISEGRDSLLICDTKEALEFEEELYKIGEYRNTFYPLAGVLIKARDRGGCGFPDRLFNYICEDEYLMRVSLKNMHSFRWIKRHVKIKVNDRSITKNSNERDWFCF